MRLLIAVFLVGVLAPAASPAAPLGDGARDGARRLVCAAKGGKRKSAKSSESKAQKKQASESRGASAEAKGAKSHAPQGTPDVPPATPAKEETAVTPRGPTRIDFDDRLVQGQTNKTGAVYLFDRKELAIRSMVRMRTSFRDQIVKDVLPK